MADLSTMFNQLGPAGGSILAGVQMGNEANAAQSEQAMRQAQMDKILMETDQAKLMNPLAIQAKQQEIASGKLKASQEEDAYRDEIIGKAIPKLASISGPARYAAMDQIFAKAGLPLDDEDRKHLFSMDPDSMLKELKAKHEWSLTQNKAYRKDMDVAKLNRDSAEKVAKGNQDAQRYAADVRASIAKDRATAEKSLQQALAGAKTFEAQSVVYTDFAEKARLAGDDFEYQRLDMLAKQAKANDLQKRAAAGDARAAQQLQLLQGLGVPMNNVPPASPAAPAASSAGGSPRKPLGSY
jgi:hypothetical protein